MCLGEEHGASGGGGTCTCRWLGQGQPAGEVTEVATQSSDEGRLCSRQGPEAGVNVAGVKTSNEVSEPKAGPARTVAETTDSLGCSRG